MQELREKLRTFFTYIDNEEEPTVNKTIAKFREIFTNEYFEDKYSINEAYYDYKKTSLYLKNSNGIKFSIVSGDWDRLGNAHSHEGIDLCITSKLAKDENVREGISIFFENEYKKHNLSILLDKFFDVDLSYESLIKNKDNNIYKTLSDDVKNQDDIVNTRYNQLKKEAEYQQRDEIEYEMISPYGGLDVEIHPVSQLLYEKILKYKDDEYFYDKAIILFNKDYEEYLKEELNNCQHALYIIDHKKEYEDILDVEYQLLLHNDHRPNINIEQVQSEKEKIESELKNLRKEYTILSTKRYRLFDIIIGTRTMDQKRMLELYNPTYQNGLIAEYEKKLLDNELEQSNYNSYVEYENELESLKKELEKKVDRPFKNFTINEEYFAPIINGRYFYSESLDKLVEQEDIYKNKLSELEYAITIVEKHTEIIEETQIEETTEEMEIAM